MRAAPLVAVVLLTLAGAGRARVADARDRTTVPLPDRLGRVISAAGVKAGKLGVLVLSLDDGSVIYEKNAEHPLIPASTAKLATTAAVLDFLGPGHVFATTLDVRGASTGVDGAFDGDLVLHGSGDPSLSKRDHEADPLWPLSSLACWHFLRTVGQCSARDLGPDDAPTHRP